MRVHLLTPAAVTRAGGSDTGRPTVPAAAAGRRSQPQVNRRAAPPPTAPPPAHPPNRTVPTGHRPNRTEQTGHRPKQTVPTGHRLKLKAGPLLGLREQTLASESVPLPPGGRQGHQRRPAGSRGRVGRPAPPSRRPRWRRRRRQRNRLPPPGKSRRSVLVAVSRTRQGRRRRLALRKVLNRCAPWSSITQNRPAARRRQTLPPSETSGLPSGSGRALRRRTILPGDKASL